ncbi:MAG: acyltransferase [Candidatus Ornithospirochaeta sp.]
MLIDRIRLIRKKIKFNKLALAGDDLTLCPRSNIFSKPGNIKVGNSCLIYGTVYSMDDGKITIGNNTCIFEKSFIGSQQDVRIGNCVIISNNVKIYDNNNHPTEPSIRHEMCLNGFFGDAWKWKHSKIAPVVIEDDVWIGERSTILKGVTIGKGSIVASNSVVTKSVPPYSIVAGNPARVVKEGIDNE